MEEERKLNFLEEIIENDLKSGKVDSILTRFPPEPNGYLHLGHAKSLCINFGLAQKYGGKTNLRYDDTNPTKEDTEYVDAIKEDIKWLGFQWEKELYASDYFDQLYEWAEQLIQRGLAYVDDQTQEEISAGRGTVETPGKESPWRNRTPEENLRIFREMRDGKYADGEKVLRAKIDMAHPNMMFRDPILYRIKHAHHHRTGDKWCIYPMYDYTHGQCDSIEHITHSICTLEFDVHRPLYDWFIDEVMRATADSTGKKIDIGFTNRGGVRIDMPKGEIFYDDIMSMFPFKNNLCYVALKGRDVRALLDQMAREKFLIIGGMKVA